ncbi:MAG TPA: hypothetical protein GXX35_11350 [Thermoanaerobacterales bacterium]|nr:hypothetical protein [Thermoanaerobacterales bacterium]
MIKEALEYLVNLGQVKTIEVNGQTYATQNLNRIKLPKATPLDINSLTGLVDYIKSGFDADAFNGTLIHIVDHSTVKLISNILNDSDRETYVTAHAFQPQFRFGYFYDTESFIILLQSCFVQNEDALRIFKLVGNIKDSVIRTYGDDGITQSVTAKVGIAQVEEVPVPNPVKLAPYRTFVEVEQPESKFVFRMRKGEDGPEAALFEADGGAWKIEAMQRIKIFLEEKLEDSGIKVIA